MIRLLIADDHQMFRRGLRRLLADDADLEIVAEASNYGEVIKHVLGSPLDVAILDLSMPGRDGIEMIAHVKTIRPALKTLILTMHDEVHCAMRALRAGADGYMTKDDAADEVVAAIRLLARGGRHVSAPVAERITLELSSRRYDEVGHRRLSDREYRVFELLVSGKRGSQIAHELSLSEKTISTHKANVLRKLNVDNDAQLVLYAVRHQLVEP